MGSPETGAGDSDSSREVRPADSTAYEERKKMRIKGFILLLQDPNLDNRWKAAEVLGNEGDASAVEPLINALKDPFVDVQWLAAKSLGTNRRSPCNRTSYRMSEI